MKIEHLEYFVEVVHHASINKAAQKIMISQPSVTAAIKALELELGFTLFERSHKGMILTEKGRKVYEDTKTILSLKESWGTMDERVPEIGGDVHLTVIPSVSSFILSQYINYLKTEYPKINLNIHEGRKSNLLSHLVQKDATIGLLAYLDGERDALYQFANKNNLTVKDLFTDHFCIYISANHPIAKKETITLDDLKTLPVAVYAGEDPVASHFTKFFKAEEKYSMNNLTAMMSLAISNNVVAVCTKSYAYLNPLVQTGVIKVCDVDGFDLPFHYCLLYPSENTITATEKIVADTLYEMFLSIM